MLLLLSPAKNLNFTRTLHCKTYTIPKFTKESSKIIKVLRGHSKKQLRELMGISDKLAEINLERYLRWKPEYTPENSRQAILAFNGEVYNGLKAFELSNESLEFAQCHVRILSGLHGILNPLDLIQPYRLEMGSKLAIGNTNNLYEFWGKKLSIDITSELKLKNSSTIINLASVEYEKAVRFSQIKARIITPVFKELRNDGFKVITIYAKKARGLMTRFIIDNRIKDPEQIKLFESGGYFYNDWLSKDNEWVFTR